jgi:rfaE bifunctional protein kinase chain/domain
VVGDDEAGRNLAKILEGSGIDCRFHVDPDTGTTVKLRVMSLNQQLLRIDFETRPSHEILQRCLADFTEYLPNADVVILSDYAKGGLHHIVEMIGQARAAGVPVVVDPKGREFGRYRGATMLTPNRREFEEAVGPCASDEEQAQKAAQLIKDFDLEQILVTRSEKGMSLYTAGGEVMHSAARAREVYDVTGAGDTVIAVVAALLGAGASAEDFLRVANTAAGVVVGKLGTAAATVAEINEALSQQTAG